MNTGKRTISAAAGMLVALSLAGCVYRYQETYTSAPPPPPHVSGVTVEVRYESDFYEPLRPHGEWVVVGSYGRCWRPVRVARDWRPYCDGRWVWTDRGWYWASDEPWGWATYHYGRWVLHASYGWIWVPGREWAPAWVSFRQGGGYMGWAPLPPEARFGSRHEVVIEERYINPRAYVFVQAHRFVEPVRPATVVINQTIVNKTVNITKVTVENNTIINHGPPAQQIEKASGRKMVVTPAGDLRRREIPPGRQPAPAPDTGRVAETKPPVSKEPPRPVTQPTPTVRPAPAPQPPPTVRPAPGPQPPPPTLPKVVEMPKPATPTSPAAPRPAPAEERPARVLALERAQQRIRDNPGQGIFTIGLQTAQQFKLNRQDTDWLLRELGGTQGPPQREQRPQSRTAPQQRATPKAVTPSQPAPKSVQPKEPDQRGAVPNEQLSVRDQAMRWAQEKLSKNTDLDYRAVAKEAGQKFKLNKKDYDWVLKELRPKK